MLKFIFYTKGSENVLDFFSNVYAFFYTLFSQIIAAFSNIRIADIIDIIIMTFVVYKAVELFRDTRAKQLFKGIFVLALIYLISVWFNLVSLKWLMIKVVDYGIIALAIVFQPELRRMLEKVGRSRFGMFRFSGSNNVNQETLKCIDAVCRASVKMQEQKCGALMVIERTTVLGEIAGTGVTIDAEISSDLICNIFYPKSPLHDGGMIIREGRVQAAGCILPLAQNNNLIAKELGTRHRAAIGMSENSDAVIVVVSEETGTISIAVNGSIKRNFTSISLREELINQIMSDEETESKGIREQFKDLVKNKLKFGRTSQNEGNKNDEQENQKNQ